MGEQTGASAKPEEMILRPQSWGDPGVPVPKGTEPCWRSWDQPASPAGPRLMLFCALSGYNPGVMLDGAQSAESGAMMRWPCWCCLCACMRALEEGVLSGCRRSLWGRRTDGCLGPPPRAGQGLLNRSGQG